MDGRRADGGRSTKRSFNVTIIQVMGRLVFFRTIDGVSSAKHRNNPKSITFSLSYVSLW